ncbi:MAG: hypothetical protein EAX89_10625, partial [Candidatus Lokiarchaeota archaeon]|nr:hypothetical protein [Candidatus Lokiarchaeota archaeon]
MAIVKQKLFARFLNPLVLNAFFLMTASIGSAPINFLFWTIMTNVYNEAEIGIATSLITMSVWLALFSRFGLEEGLRRYLPDYNKSKTDLIISSTLIILISSVIISIIGFSILFLISSEYSNLNNQILFMVILLTLVIANDLSSILGATFAGLRVSFLVFVRTIIVILVKIPICIFLVNLGAIGLILGTSLAIWIVTLCLWKFGLPIAIKDFNPKFHIDLSKISEMSIFALGNYIANLLSIFPRSFLPILVLELLSPEYSAYFYVSWMIGNMILAMPEGIGASFMIEEASATGKKHANQKQAIVLMTILIIPAVLGIFFFGKFLLQLFGGNYAIFGFELLLILAIAAIPASINTFFIFYFRLKHQLKPILIININVTTLTIVGSFFFIPKFGLLAIGIC